MLINKMKNLYLKRIICFIFLIACSFSCSSDLDFDQANDLKVSPVIVGNLIYFDIPVVDFPNDHGLGFSFAFKPQNFDIFRDKYLNKYLQEADFYFEVDNTINREFTVEMELLDENNQNLYSIYFDVPAYNGINEITTKKEVFKGANLRLLKRTRNMGVNITAKPSSISNSTTGSFKLRSSATLYLTIE